MNKRIKELLNQCSDPELTKPWPLIDSEKFAQLIAWECFLIGSKYILSNDDVSKFERNLKETFRSQL